MSDGSVIEKPALRTTVMVSAWVWVAVPFGWGMYNLVLRIPALFGV